MRAKGKSGSAALALVLTSLAGRSEAEDVKAPAGPEELANALIEATKPVPEHAKLQPLAGGRTYTRKTWLDPGKPPNQMKRTMERK